MFKMLLETAHTGILPGVKGSDERRLRTATPISAENIKKGWHKLYPPNASLNPFYEIVRGMPEDWVAPPNSPAGRLTTVSGDWGNMVNMALVQACINLVKGRLFRLYNPMGEKTLNDNLTAASKGDVEAAKAIERVFQDVS